jgi:hypothetical protein
MPADSEWAADDPEEIARHRAASPYHRRMLRRRLPGLGLLAGVFLAAAANAGAASQPLSLASYRSHANTICRREQVASVSRLHSAKDLAQYLAEETPVLQGALATLRVLAPPLELAVLQTEIIGTVRGEATLFASLAKRAAAGKLTETQWQNNQTLEHLDARELTLWTEIGAKACANP